MKSLFAIAAALLFVGCQGGPQKTPQRFGSVIPHPNAVGLLGVEDGGVEQVVPLGAGVLTSDGGGTVGSLYFGPGGGGGGTSGVPNIPSGLTGAIVPIADGGANGAYWAELTANLVAPAFSMGISGAGVTTEIGGSVVNPTLTLSYANGSPASATITNTDGINSPFVLTTPYTTAHLTGTFSHLVNAATVTFNASSTSTSSQNATAAGADVWYYAIACGVSSSSSPVAGQSEYNTLVAQTKLLLGNTGGSFACAASSTTYCECALPATYTLNYYQDTSGFTYTPGAVGTASITNQQSVSGLSYTFTTAGATGAHTTFSLH